METTDILRALANERRLRILEWLKDPTAHFPPQVDGDLVEDGVCGVNIAAKLGLSQPTLSEHMRILVQAGLVRGRNGRHLTATTRAR
jgi:ArsR family transcriptional regulator